MRQIHAVIISVLFLFLPGCFMPPETIRDIRDLSQEHTYYIHSNREMVSDVDQQKMDANYSVLFFSPWHQTTPSCPLEKVTHEFHKFEKYPGYDENGRKHKKSWVQMLLLNTSLEDYPNADFPAITTDHKDLRVLPTHKPSFHNFRNGYSGHPFDKLQESFVAANTPLFIFHMTKDKAWVLAETSYATGWIVSRDIAFTDTDFIRMWERGLYAIIIIDKTPLYNEGGQFLVRAPLGSFFPKVEEQMDGFKVLVAEADMNRKAFIGTSVIPKSSAVSKPLRLRALNMA